MIRSILFFLVVLLMQVGASPRIPDAFLKIPILSEGRIKPLDSWARHNLLQIYGKSSLRLQGQKVSAAEWQLQVMLSPQLTDTLKTFLVENPEVRDAIGMKGKERDRYSYKQLKPQMKVIWGIADGASKVEGKNRSAFEKDVIRVALSLKLYESLRNGLIFLRAESLPQKWSARIPNYYEMMLRESELGPRMHEVLNRDSSLRSQEESAFLEALETNFAYAEEWGKVDLPIYPFRGNTQSVEWLSPGALLLQGGVRQQDFAQWLSLWNSLRTAWVKEDGGSLQIASEGLLKFYIAQLQVQVRPDALSAELIYNRMDPLYRAMILLGLAWILQALLSFRNFKWGRRIAWGLSGIGFLLVSVGMLLRIKITLRPPVTNLYETFVFAAWSGMLLVGILAWKKRWKAAEWLIPMLGFGLLLLARRHGMDGDTMPVLSAVLDSNFWLTVHVITITLGYAGVVASGAAAHIHLWNENPKHYTMVRGLQAFGLLFTFIGTLLGGIWADQSWGRFWGWDPKENGALLIVLWSAFLFHAIPAKWIKARGFSIGSVLGIQVVLFAWFGVNLLGVGLHSYGFTEGTFRGLIGFAILEFVFLMVVFLKKFKKN